MSTEINAITLHCMDMARSFRFYTTLGLTVRYGSAEATFTSFELGSNYINLQLTDVPPSTNWGRVVMHVDSPDEVYQRCLAADIEPEMAPSDAPWGERYFHVRDPDGHELSFARLLDS